MARVLSLMQENKTPDFYFPTLAAWGANIQNRGNLLATPPLPDPPHDRDAWVHYRMGDYPATTLQIDNDTLLGFSRLGPTRTIQACGGRRATTNMRRIER
jgi:hypothetical protein